jgi:rhodanese-related sulfurtransferase
VQWRRRSSIRRCLLTALTLLLVLYCASFDGLAWGHGAAAGVGAGAELEARDDDDMTPLLAACEHGGPSAAAAALALLRAGADATAVERRTALHVIGSCNNNDNIGVAMGLSGAAAPRHFSACCRGLRIQIWDFRLTVQALARDESDTCSSCGYAARRLL